MATVAHFGADGKEKRRAGMHAPKKVHLMEKWYQNALKAVKLEHTGNLELVKVDEDFIIFNLHQNGHLVINRKGNALST